MSEITYNAVNIDAKVIEEQNENIKAPKNSYQNQKKVTFDPKNYLNVILGPNETNKTLKVRFIPISATDGRVFFDVDTHSIKVNREVSKSGFKSYFCLNDKNTESKEECPICAMSKQLFAESKKTRDEGNEVLAKSLFKEACQFKKKKTFITRVIDRDHEDEGVKFWKFNENSKGEGVYDKLMSLYNTRKQESIDDGEGEYNIFDLYNGKDIIINISKSQIPDGRGGVRDLIAYNITDSGNRKPLSKDVELANKWLNDDKKWSDVYGVKSADFIKVVANGGVPVFNSEFGCFVERSANNEREKKANEQAATELLQDQTSGEDVPIDEFEDDLPF